MEANGNWYGAWYEDLTASTIRVCRGSQDNAADRIHVRVWITSSDPDADSGWMNINPGQTITFNHGLAITATDLTVGLTFSGTLRGVHNLGYGGLALDPVNRLEGAHWQDLTDTRVSVTRHPSDTQITQARVIVVHGGTPAYDSLVDLGGWQPVAAGTSFTFTHSLNWDPDYLMVRAECASPVFGIHQLLAGGNHHWAEGWKGANLQNLTRNTVAVYRYPADDVCPTVRVRAWKRRLPAYLPLILRNYSTP
jgi:hypothetical protein